MSHAVCINYYTHRAYPTPRFDLGIAFRVKYGHLLQGFTDLPVFRTISEGNALLLCFSFTIMF